MSNTLVSIVTVVLNNREGLYRTFQSVIHQTYRPIELIIIDGDSSDGTKLLLEEIRQQKFDGMTIKIISEKDEGVYHAMNKGINLSTGDWVFFLNAGDIFIGADTLDKIPFDAIDEKVGIIFGNVLVKYPKGKEELLDQSVFIKDRSMFLYKTINHQTIFFRRSAVKVADGYNTKYKIAADTDLILRIVFDHGFDMFHVPLPITIFEYGGLSTKRFFRTWLEHNSIVKRYFPYSKILLKDIKKLPRYIWRLYYVIVRMK